jgi:hypothetical protein
MKNKILTTVMLLTATLAFGQETEIPAMVTDRPDATESPLTVPKGFLQVETGAFFETFEKDSFKTETLGYNTSLFRYGILDNLELRVGINYEENKLSMDDVAQEIKADGLTPLLFGAKVEIADEDGWIPQIGLLGHLYLPFTASEAFKPNTTGADFRFSFAHTLSEKSSLSYNLGGQWGNDSPELAYIYTLSYGYSVTDSFGFYVEIYGDFPENTKANHLWDAGFTYALQPNIQLDATIGTSFTEGQDLFLSAGVSFRIPKLKK